MMSVSEEITFLESRLTSINAKIEAQEHLSEVEEGGTNARFRSKFTNIDTLYTERNNIKLKLVTLTKGSLI